MAWSRKTDPAKGNWRSVGAALGVSVLVHFALLIVLELLVLLGLLLNSDLFQLLVQQDRRIASQNREQSEEIPLVFVEVDPSQMTQEAPEDTKFYSARNSLASDPDPAMEWPTPKLEGLDRETFQTLNQPRTLQTRLEPPAEPAPELPSETSPPAQEAPKPGDLAMVRPSDQPQERPPEPKPKPERPRTLAQARQMLGMPSERTRQEGGARRHSLQPSFDARATAFGAYDEAIINAIRMRWFDLLDQRDYVRSRSGKVVLEFRLKYDGRITDMRVAENEVGELLALICQRAVMEPAPYGPWPSDLRRLVGGDYREVRFTFYYN